MVKKDTWVRIKKIILEPHERTGNIPDDTKKVPLEMWTKGYLLNDANIKDLVKVKTLTGRIEEGILIEVNPSYMHTYGKFVPEILEIGHRVKKALFGGDNHE